jgi:FMN phosphatase YigB (HAD superfamily)
MLHKKLRIFDFDDTLAKVKSRIHVKNTITGKEFILTPAQFAVYSPVNGDTFNFKEFNSIIKTATPIKTNIDLIKRAAADTNTRVTILTARMLGYPVKRYLEKNFNLSVYVVALGDANPQKKADYIEKQIKKGYDDIVFIDDSIKNVRAVEKLQSKYPEVELNVIHTTEAEKLQNEVKRHFS